MHRPSSANLDVVFFCRKRQLVLSPLLPPTRQQGKAGAKCGVVGAGKKQKWGENGWQGGNCVERGASKTSGRLVFREPTAMAEDARPWCLLLAACFLPFLECVFTLFDLDLAR
jgi:hypothetical protein